ncbi:MAG: hypothetical protein LBS29_03300 [Endomicrobium sp.]|nr:hypothetical protein [Endomicrobium sp.]
MDISAQAKSVIRDIRDFPIQGIVFKDIMPLFRNINLFRNVIDVFDNFYQNVKVDKIIGIESRGFIVVMLLALKMNIHFVPIRNHLKQLNLLIFLSTVLPQ